MDPTTPADADSAEPPRYAIPDRLRGRARELAGWLRIVGAVQLVVSSLALLLVVARFAAESPGSDVTLLVVTTITALCLWQGTTLVSAAAHLRGIGGEPRDAHEQLRHAFARLQGALIMDGGLAALMLCYNAVTAVRS